MKTSGCFVRKAMRAGCLAVLVCLSLSGQAQRRPDKITSPEIQPDNSVIFRVKAPGASSVQVFGSWPTRFKNAIPMTKKDGDVYEVKVGPLPSDMYEYEFAIDSVSVLDPRTNMVTRDGAWIMNRLMIPGPQAELYDARNVPHGQISTVWYASPTLGVERRMNIYTPPGYVSDKKSYPVLYLLHGGGGDEEAWLSRGRANYILDNLIAAGKAVPMIVVITNGNPVMPAAPLDRPIASGPKAPDIATMASGKFEESLVKDVIPYIEKNYRVIKDADHRAITGFSMGGLQTQNTTNRNPGMFKYIGVMSMGLFSALNQQATYSKEDHVKQLEALKKSNPKVYWIACGKEDFAYPSVTKLKELYDQIGFKYTTHEDESRHDFNAWRPFLTQFMSMTFK